MQELERKHQEEIRSINAAHLVEWQEFQARKIDDVEAHVAEGCYILKELISK